MLASCYHCHGSGKVSASFATFSSNYCKNYYADNCDTCAQLVSIQRKVDEARRVLDALLVEREALTEAVNNKHDPFVRHLPPEVVCNVFTHCLPFRSTPYSFPDEGTNHPMDILSALLTLGRVCRQWRFIIEGTPEFWTVLPITISSQRYRQLSVLQNWLCRSREMPLSIRFVVGDDFPQDHRMELRQIVDQIALHARRLKVLDLRVPLEVLEWIFDNHSISSTAIQALSIDDAEDDVSAHLGVMLPINEAPSRLRLMGLASCIMRIGSWENLIDLHCHSMTIEACLQLLQISTNLTTFHLDDPDDDLFSGEGLDPLTHQSLQTLRVTRATSLFWEVVIFPSLKELSLVDLLDEARDAIYVCNFLDKSACTLESLGVEGDDVVEDAVLQVLHNTPNLRKLSVVNVELSPAFFTVQTFALLRSLEHMQYTTRMEDKQIFQIGIHVPGRNQVDSSGVPCKDGRLKVLVNTMTGDELVFLNSSGIDLVRKMHRRVAENRAYDAVGCHTCQAGRGYERIIWMNKIVK